MSLYESAIHRGCWLRRFDDETPCAGYRLDRCHLIPKRLILDRFRDGSLYSDGDGRVWIVCLTTNAVRRHNNGRELAGDPVAILQQRIVWDPGIYVPGCEAHHHRFDRRYFTIPRYALPVDAEDFARRWGFCHDLDRIYGERRPELADGTSTRDAAHETLREGSA